MLYMINKSNFKKIRIFPLFDALNAKLFCYIDVFWKILYKFLLIPSLSLKIVPAFVS